MVEHEQLQSSNINRNYSFSTRYSNHVRSIQITGLLVRFRSHSRPATAITQKFLCKPSAVCSCSTARSQRCRQDAPTNSFLSFGRAICQNEGLTPNKQLSSMRRVRRGDARPGRMTRKENETRDYQIRFRVQEPINARVA
jgi:hypothetical protein